uniref:cell division cycle protein 16 homolog n=1 Tax=Ciona intestinalis TaxID=7719 RepID=UPI00006A58CE|nr:cell division cycle protein 16 homolog [Ciona intestinalis]|eukprot:XP_009859251.1 cell division cycle protein 16 homolog [Ciona intestinalis]
MSEAILNRVRNIVIDYTNKHQYESALFWSDKAASLSQYHASDVYRLAQSMFHMKQFERAAVLIIKRKLHLKYNAFRYLVAKCYASCKEWQLALDVLETVQPDGSTSMVSKKILLEAEKVEGVPEDKEMIASLHLLRGDIYEAMDVRDIAADCYKEAVKADVFCYEAFDRLIGHHMLRAEEEQDLLDSLPMRKQCKSVEEQNLLRFLYDIKLKKYNKPGQLEVPDSVDNLHENLDIATSLAERHYYNCEFKTSYKITENILKCDPYHGACLPLHVALLVELKKSNKLFYLAHQLVSRYPELPISWYAVGCYYLLQPKKQELARRYLLKTTLLDKMYGPAWLAYGHSFASENEHDQAMAAYFTASQLMKGCHLPFLYIGLEYSVTNNTKLAEKFFSTALEICPDDPHVLHEMGVASCTNNDYQSAVEYFNKALNKIQELGDEVSIEEWKPLLNNLGHVHRHLKNYPQALTYHRQALVLSPHSADTYTNIGFVLSYMGNYLEAIEYLHKSLGLRRDDAFTASLLDTVIEQFSDSDIPVYGEVVEPPELPPTCTREFAYKPEDSLIDCQSEKPRKPLQPAFSDASGDSTTATPSPNNPLTFNYKLEVTDNYTTPEEAKCLDTPMSGITALNYTSHDESCSKDTDLGTSMTGMSYPHTRSKGTVDHDDSTWWARKRGEAHSGSTGTLSTSTVHGQDGSLLDQSAFTSPGTEQGGNQVFSTDDDMDLDDSTDQ